MLTQADVRWIELGSVDSTNDYLIRSYQAGAASGVTAVLAHEQTQGKGRAGRVWYTVPRGSLCLSIGLPVCGSSLPFLPLCVGLGLAQVIEGLGVAVRLKWPNDLLVNNQKLGGVLCESFQSLSGPVTVLGIGINLKTPTLPPVLGALGATSLQAHLPDCALPTARSLAEQFLPAILGVIENSQTQGIQAIFSDFSSRDAWLGCELEVVQDGRICLRGIARGINGQGAYLIETAHGLKTLHVGDLSLRVQA